MNRVNIYRSTPKEQTAIPNLFIDEYMAGANDAQLKIYLFLMRMLNANLPTSIADIADKFNYTEKDVLRALTYWEDRRLLVLDWDAAHNLSGIQVRSLEQSCEQPKAAARVTPVLSLVQSQEDKPDDRNAKPGYSLDDLKRFKSSEEVAQLLMVAEQYVGRQLTRSDMETVLFLYDRLSFSADLIDYLIQHCVERGKKDFRYIEKVALSWHEQGITTPKDAQSSSRKYDKIVYTIMKSLGKTAAPAPKELEYIDKWTKEYGFLPDIIQEACDKTVMTTDSHRFAYADGILSKWYQAGVRCKADIARADASRRQSAQTGSGKVKSDTNVTKNKFNNFSQNTYDFDRLEQTILSN
ncbi:MAG: DnaD domain protein [Roseburia sp.]|nr:DnaD domain protein [Roseburia sp.]